MAKKSKRGKSRAKKTKRSRPKSTTASRGIGSMTIEALLKLRDEIGTVLSSKAATLQNQLAQLGQNGNRRGRPPGGGSALRGTKVAPKYRSKKNPKLTWSGRGAMVGWMKEEMKGTKLKKEDFRIAK